MSRQYIGSSDAATVLGIDPWRTEEQLIRRILYDEYPEHDARSLERMEWGKRLEPIIIDAFEERTGLKVVARQLKIFHTQHDFLGVTLDGLTEDGSAVVEVKTSLPFAGPMKKWQSPEGLVVPEMYQAQCAHAMMITGRAKAYVPVLFGLDRMEILEVQRNEEFIADLLKAEVAWWRQHIEPHLKPRAA